MVKQEVFEDKKIIKQEVFEDEKVIKREPVPTQRATCLPARM